MLKPLGWLYGRIVDLRHSFYNKGFFKSFPLGTRTISIGNITAGGTGKTPLVAYVADLLSENGERVCILTRGYGRENPKQRVLVSDLEKVLVNARTGGDEPVELARKLVGKAIIVADADRIAAAEWAKKTFGITAFVLDDGFQHRRALRDLDIVCIDATDPFGGGSLLPAGRLREPLHNLERAHAIVITRTNLVDNVSGLAAQISGHTPNARIFEARSEIINIVEIGRSVSQLPVTDDPRLYARIVKSFAFCGLGNPSNFFKQLAVDGFDLAGKKPFPDHYYYKQEGIRKLENLAHSSGAEILLTTSKDAVKLSDIEFAMPCLVVETETQLDDAEGFRKIIISSS